MRIALVQMRSGQSMVVNVEAACALVEEAARYGVDYVQTPEMTTVVERDREQLQDEVTGVAVDAALARFSALAQALGITLHIGSMAVPLADGRFANRAHLFGPDGGLVATYDKVHMFDVDLANGESWRESAIYAPGDRCVVVDLGRARVGLGICYDLRFADFFRTQAQTGAEVLTVPAAFTRQTGEAHWYALLRARAIETGSFVLAAAQGGTHDDGRETFGHSLVVDPWGEVIAERANETPGVLSTEIDLSKVADARGKIPALKHNRTFTVEAVNAASTRAVA